MKIPKRKPGNKRTSANTSTGTLAEVDVFGVVDSTADTIAARVVQRLLELNSQQSTTAPSKTAIRHLIATFDGLETAIEEVTGLSSPSKRTAKRFAPLLRLLQVSQRSLLNALEDFLIYPIEQSECVDHRRDQIVDVRPSPNKVDDGRIAGVVRKGFVLDGQTLRAPLVQVMKFVPEHERNRNKKKE